MRLMPVHDQNTDNLSQSINLFKTAFLEIVLIEPEIMPHFVDDGNADFVAKLTKRMAHFDKRRPENSYALGACKGVGHAAFCKRYPFVQSQKVVFVGIRTSARGTVFVFNDKDQALGIFAQIGRKLIYYLTCDRLYKRVEFFLSICIFCRRNILCINKYAALHGGMSMRYRNFLFQRQHHESAAASEHARYRYAP